MMLRSARNLAENCYLDKDQGQCGFVDEYVRKGQDGLSLTRAPLRIRLEYSRR